MWASAAARSARWLRGTPLPRPVVPGGVEHEREVVFAGTGCGFGRRRQQVCEWHRALGPAAGPDTAEPRGTGGVSHGRSGGPVEGQRRGAGIREEVIQLVGAASPVERHRDDAGKLAGPVERRHLPPVLHDDGEPVSRPKFERAQAARDARNGVEPRGVIEAPLAIDDGKRVRISLGRRNQHTAEVSHPRSTAPPRPRAQPPQSRNSPCSGRDGR